MESSSFGISTTIAGDIGSSSYSFVIEARFSFYASCLIFRSVSFCFHSPYITSVSLVWPSTFFSNAFNWIMKPGLGAACYRTAHTSLSPSLSGIFLSFRRYASKKLVARDFPAKQWMSTLLTGSSPSLLHASALLIKLLDFSTKARMLWFGLSRQLRTSYLKSCNEKKWKVWNLMTRWSLKIAFTYLWESGFDVGGAGQDVGYPYLLQIVLVVRSTHTTNK